MKTSSLRALGVSAALLTLIAGSAAAAGPSVPGRAALIAELGRDRVAVSSSGLLRFAGGSDSRPLADAGRLGRFGNPRATARRFLARYGSLFGVADPGRDLVVDRASLADGRTHVRFRQHADGVPVIAGEIIVQVDDAGNVISAAGEAMRSAPSLRPAVSARQAAATATAAVARELALPAAELIAAEPQLALYDPALVGASSLAGARLVWRTRVTAAGAAVDWYALVDAVSGGIALRFDQLADAAASLVCRADANDTKVPCVWPEAEYVDWQEGSAPGPEVVAAIERIQDYFDFFYNRFDRAGIDQSMPHIATINYCPGSCAFPNAYWDGYQTVFWPGMATDDIIAHEFVHGITEFDSGLLYFGQSGAINEALSDIFGELVDLTNDTADDSPGDEWLIGEASSLGAIRSMADPQVHGQPDRMRSSLFSADEGDNFGVHTNSGVANKAAQLMVAGGAFNGQTVTGLGIDKAAGIWYRVANRYLWSGSDYADLGLALNQACSDMVAAATAIRDGDGAYLGSLDAADCGEVAKVVLATEMAEQPIVAGAAVSIAPTGCATGAYVEDLRDAFAGTMFSSAAAGWTRSPASRWSVTDMYTRSIGSSLWGRTPAAAGSGEASRSLGTLAQSSYLVFEHAYILDHDTTRRYDGGLIEYSVDGGSSWQDAGALITHNGYNGQIASGFGNPLGGRAAFVGWSPRYLTTRLDLSNLAGQQIRLRFLTGTDSVVEDAGWFIDNLVLFHCAGATDNVAPSVSAPNAGLVTGVQLGSTNPIKLNIALGAFDAGGVQSTALQRRTNSGAWSAVALGSATGTTVDLAYPTSSTAKRQFRAMATDTAGNASPWALGPAFRVLAFQNGSAPVAQSGKWKSRSSSSFYGKSARSSSALGARQVLNIVASDFAIVSTLGPNRGRFEVYVDGNYRQTIDLYAPTTSFRRVVYAIDFGASGSHRIDLRVTHTKSASSSGYRVDFDAFLALAP